MHLRQRSWADHAGYTNPAYHSVLLWKKTYEIAHVLEYYSVAPSLFFDRFDEIHFIFIIHFLVIFVTVFLFKTSLPVDHLSSY